MSHNMKVKTQIKDKGALLKALDRMGYKGKYQVFSKPRNIIAYNGVTTPEKAEIIIPRQFIHRLSNDFGFTKEKDGNYRVIVDDGYMRKDPDWTNRLNAFYGVEKVKMECEARGYEYYEDTTDKNQPRLTINTSDFGSSDDLYNN